nr:hypothetical protein [Nocardioides ungokensis]
MVAAITPSGHRTTYTYDPVTGLLASRRDPDGATWRYEHTTAGRLAAPPTPPAPSPRSNTAPTATRPAPSTRWADPSPDTSTTSATSPPSSSPTAPPGASPTTPSPA